MKRSILALLVPLSLCTVVGGCSIGSTASCSCAAVSVTLQVPDAVAADVSSITVGPDACGAAVPTCASPLSTDGGGGCRAYQVTLAGPSSIEHVCEVEVTFTGNRKVTTEFAWRVDPDGCCGNRTFRPSPFLVLPLPASVDGGARD